MIGDLECSHQAKCYIAPLAGVHCARIRDIFYSLTHKTVKMGKNRVEPGLPIESIGTGYYPALHPNEKTGAERRECKEIYY